MHHLDFFDIPVYRLPLDEYEAAKAKYIEATMYPLESEEGHRLRKDYYTKLPGEDAFMRRHLDKCFGGPWRYNEIIAYIRLYFLGSQIRGQFFKVDAKRIIRTRKKVLVWQTDKVVSEGDLPRPRSNENVYQAIIGYLDRAKAKLKGRYIDTELFETIGRHVDWVGMIEAQSRARE